jgi:hypothetical protein
MLTVMNTARPVLGSALLVAGLLTSGCSLYPAETCDPRIVEAFHALPALDGLEVDLQGSPGIGCTDTVTPADPEAFVDHYEGAMRDAGWAVDVDGDDGVFGRGPSGGIGLDRLEGDDVGVYAVSLEDLDPASG